MKKIFITSVLLFLILAGRFVFAADTNIHEQDFSQKIQDSVKYGKLSSEKLSKGDVSSAVLNITKSIELSEDAKKISTQYDLNLTAEDRIFLDGAIADYYINRAMGLELGLQKSPEALVDIRKALTLASDKKTIDRVFNFIDAVIAQKKYAQAEKYIALVIDTPNIDRQQLAYAYQTRAVVRQNYLDNIEGGNQDYQNYLRYK